MIKEWMDSYQPKNQEEAGQAIREILQEVALAGLHRNDFFDRAAFYGGTALRIFYGLDRFSEDLDFSLLMPTETFSLEPYLNGIVEECRSMGIQVSVTERIKTNKTNIESAFLKSDTIWKELELVGIAPQAGIGLKASIKIKLEVDTFPPMGFRTEEKLLLKPFSFYVKCFTLPDLFAGKMHAVLFRKWGTRVKGRDWYDMEWYIKKGIPLNLEHLLTRARNSGDRRQTTLTQEQFMRMLRLKIKRVSINQAKEDIVRFIKNARVLDIWSEKYFLDLIEQIKFK